MGVHCPKPDSIAIGLIDEYNFREEVQSHGELSRFLNDLSHGPERLTVCGFSPFFLVLMLEEYLRGNNLKLQVNIGYPEFVEKLDRVIFDLEAFLETLGSPSEEEILGSESLLEFYFERYIDIELDMRLPVLHALLRRARIVAHRLGSVSEQVHERSTGLILGGSRAMIANIFQEPN